MYGVVFDTARKIEHLKQEHGDAIKQIRLDNAKEYDNAMDKELGEKNLLRMDVNFWRQKDEFNKKRTRDQIAASEDSMKVLGDINEALVARVNVLEAQLHGNYLWSGPM
jgi:hypothetical protein